MAKPSTKPPKPRSLKAEAADPATAPERLAELAAQAVELARVVAKNAAAPEALLTELSHSADLATRRALVTNPATPLNVLREIAKQFPEELLDNPALDVFLLENPTFFRDLPAPVLRAMVKRDNCSAGVLAQVVQVDDEVVLLGICQNPAATPETVRALQASTSAAVREAASLHVAVAGAVDDWPGRLRAAVARALVQADPAQRLRSLPFLRLADQVASAAPESSAPAHLLFNEITQDAARVYSAAAVLERLAGDEDSWVRLAVAQNPATPVALREQLLERLVGDADSSVRSAVAAHPATPVALLERLAGDADWKVRLAVAEHPATPVTLREQLLERLAGDADSWVRRAVAEHPATPLALLERLAGDKKNSWVRRAVAEHPATPLATLECLLHDENGDVRRAACKSLSKREFASAAPPALVPEERAAVEARLAQDARQFTAANKPSLPRLLAVLSPWAPVEALAKYFRSTGWEERAAIAIHPATPPATQAKLADDGNAVVRAVARAALAASSPTT